MSAWDSGAWGPGGRRPPGGQAGGRERSSIEPDRVPVGKAVLVAAVVLVVFAAGIFVTGLEQRAVSGTVHDANGAPVTAAGEPRVGMVDQPDYALGSTAARELDAQRARLESWGWTDRAHGRIHEPIEAAMDAIAAQPGAKP